jgi:amidase
VFKPSAIAAVAVALTLTASPAWGASCPTTLGGLDLTTATIPQLRAALDSGQITSTGLVQAYLDRIYALNRRGPVLRPVIRTTPNALAQAQAWDAAHALGQPSFGPLAGIPVLLKDNLDTRDLQTTAGAKAMIGTPPPRDAFLTARLRQAGAIVLGKTNMDEWATTISRQQPHGFSDVGGLTLNPYTRGLPSGSSGGSAVAAASGLAGSTVGTETSGSIIDPAWVNSTVGIKPTRGLVSRGGVIPLLEQYDTPGPIDQNVTDAAVMLGLLTGVDPRDPVTRTQAGHASADYTQFLDTDSLQGARIGVPKLHDKIDLLRIPELTRIEDVLRARGATIVPVDSFLLLNVVNGKVFANAFLAQFRKQVDTYLHGRGRTSPRHSFAAVVAYNAARGKRAVRYGQDSLLEALGLSRREVRRSAATISKIRQADRDALRDAFDADHLDALLVSRGISAITSTPAGYPSITVPAGYLGPKPYGIILTGRPWDEPKLIGYAYDFEQATHAWRSPATIDPKFAAACPA